jgi:DNA polymerase
LLLDRSGLARAVGLLADTVAGPIDLVAAIEARGVAWAAGETQLIEAFRDGRPIYKEMAAEIYGKPVAAIEKGTVEYQIGKNTILGAGYGMGWEKFKAMVKLQTGIDISDEFAKHAINTYRTKYAGIKNHWYRVEGAAIKAVETPGAVFRAGPIRFTFRGAYLYMILPSGRPLAYFRPEIVDRETPWGDIKPAIEVSHENQVTHQWERTALYGGLLVENEVQALSRDVMAEAMLRVEPEYPIVLSVHDEIVSEREKGKGSVEEFIGLMSETPAWAPGLPVAAEGWRAERYKK